MTLRKKVFLKFIHLLIDEASKIMERKSFASIEQKVHSNINNCIFDFANVTIDSNENEQIVEEMFTFFSKKIPKENAGTGEWEWLQNNKQNKFSFQIFNEYV